MSAIYICRCGEKKEPCYQCVNHTCNMLRGQLKEVMTGLTLIESSLINLRPRDKSPIDRRFGDLIKDIEQLKEQG